MFRDTAREQELLDGHDRYVEIIEALKEIKLYKEAYKLEACGRNGYVLICPEGHQVYALSRCDLRICNDCALRFGKRLWRRYLPVLRVALKWDRPGYSLKLLTLTKRNRKSAQDCETLQGEFRQFFKDVRKFLDSVFPKEKGCGALAVLEVTKNFTIHCHVLLYGPFVLQGTLSDLWLEITGDSCIVDIRQVKGSVRLALNYILKYIQKPCFFERPKDYALYLGALKGVRRVHSYGLFYNFSVDEEEKPPIVCPFCGGSLEFDRDFYFRFGTKGCSWLKYRLGIEPLVV